MIRFETIKTIDAVKEDLRRTTHRPTLMMELAFVSNPQLVGTVTDTEFDVYWVKPLVGNIFRPHFKGRVFRSGDKTVLEGAFVTGVLGKMLVFLFLAILAVVEFAILLRAGASVFTNSFVPVSLSLFALLVFQLGRIIGRQDIGNIKAAISGAL